MTSVILVFVSAKLIHGPSYCGIDFWADNEQ